MKIKSIFPRALAAILILISITSMSFSLNADEATLSYSDALAAFKADMEDPEHIDTVASAYLYCLSTETELLDFDADPSDKKSPGETAKLLTALTAYSLIEDQDQTVTVTSSMASRFTGHRYGYKAGNVVSYRDLLKTLTVRNANDSAIILAYALCGNIQDFAYQMNLKATELGLKNSYFTNPTGDYDLRMYTTARDIFLVANSFHGNKELMRYVGSQYIRLDNGSLIYNRNYLISSYYNGGKSYLNSSATGMVAGSSSESGYVIARSQVYDSYEYICVILGATKDQHFIYSYDVSAELIKWGAKNHSFLSVLDKNTPVTTLPVKNARENDTVPIVPSDTLTKYMLSNAFESGKLRTEMTFTQSELTAPIASGTDVGEICVYYEDELIIKSRLLTACEISENTTSSMIHTVWNAISSKRATKVYIVVTLCVLLYILINSVIRYQRKIRRSS